jgi:hypothetical protein
MVQQAVFSDPLAGTADEEKALRELLAELGQVGITLPSDTSSFTFLERLRAACRALAGLKAMEEESHLHGHAGPLHPKTVAMSIPSLADQNKAAGLVVEANTYAKEERADEIAAEQIRAFTHGPGAGEPLTGRLKEVADQQLQAFGVVEHRPRTRHGREL